MAGLALAAGLCCAAPPGQARAATVTPARGATVTVDPLWPKTLESALAIDLPLAVTAGDEAAAQRFLRRVRRGHRLFALRRKGMRKRIWLQPEHRNELARAQFKRRLTNATFAAPAKRRLVRDVYAGLTHHGLRAFKLPRTVARGVATLHFGDGDFASCLSNGAVFLSESELLQFELAAVRWQRASTPQQFLHALMHALIEATAEKPPTRKPHSLGPEVILHMRAMLANALGHEMTHSIQNLAFSTPTTDWTPRERRNREREADAGGVWLAACAGYPLEAVLIDGVAVAMMDAVARSQGVREKPYPPWERRVASTFKTVDRIRRLHARGGWPKRCAPFSIDPKRLLKRRVVTRWLKQISTPAGFKAAFARPPRQLQRPAQGAVAGDGRAIEPPTHHQER